ncbi:flagellar biosynthesis protein FlhB [Thiospirochaeta perfilievii]|uniref:Flagellar biosynthetic protein FlhB n=1 Tax=Thiospirochaeta perfilievii TaxID=252967 RepID=A0A5C1QFV9_9SPIO|nr:flagellar biosynthesis protein FlhB [Thiospirochaeta perfilievii]QEN06030.1 flagellar biosynthesis protein FlhB [Thiospirochaeta perfilievii]
MSRDLYYKYGEVDLPYIGLQWFAAEDEGRTEDATEQKKKKSREEGKVAKSSELVAALVVLLPISTLGILGSFFWGRLYSMMRFYLSNIDRFELMEFGTLIPSFFSYYGSVVGPIAIIAVISAILANLLQVGFLFTTKAIEPKFEKIAPNIGKYITKTLFSMEAVYNLLKSIFKIGIIGFLAYLNVKSIMPNLVVLMNHSITESFSLIAGTAFKMMIQAAVIMLAISIPDYLFQRNQHLDSIKMSKQEVKEEYKQMEGDPQIKGRLKQKMQEILNSTMIQNVPKADVVVTNPTHFAVALEYDSQTMIAPRVSAKGQDNIALNIKQVAKDNGVPIIENKPLARGLYADTEIGDTVPDKYWSIVATVLAEVKRIDKSIRG